MAELALGTVQFGLNYGITNVSGQVSRAEAGGILNAVLADGIDLIDTAAVYGQAEAVLGELIPRQAHPRIVTKLPPLPADLTVLHLPAYIESCFANACSKLRRHHLYGLMVHRVSDLLGPLGEELHANMQCLREQGRVEKLGASVYEPHEVFALLERGGIDLIQLPFNVLDRRMLAEGALEALAAAKIEVHVRSVFLQGILLLNETALPAHLASLQPLMHEYESFLSAHDLTPLEAALGFVRSRAEVDALVVGVQTRAEWQEIFAAFARPDLPDEWPQWPQPDRCLIDPRCWPHR